MKSLKPTRLIISGVTGRRCAVRQTVALVFPAISLSSLFSSDSLRFTLHVLTPEEEAVMSSGVFLSVSSLRGAAPRLRCSQVAPSAAWRPLGGKPLFVALCQNRAGRALSLYVDQPFFFIYVSYLFLFWKKLLIVTKLGTFSKTYVMTNNYLGGRETFCHPGPAQPPQPPPPPAAPCTYDWNGALGDKQKASTCVSLTSCIPPSPQAGWGLSRVYRGQTAQWLCPNLWGGSGTVLFLAPHSRVSVSCGSYQLPGPDDWPAALSPARPHRGVSALLSH